MSFELIPADIPENKKEMTHHPGHHLVDFFSERLDTDGRWQQYTDFIEKAVNNEANFIDKGGAGRVYEFGPKSICIKLMEERHHSQQSEMFQLGNSVASEAWFLDRLSDFCVEGVRTPVFVEYFEGARKTGIAMEKLDAVNLQHVINGSEPLPENFDMDDFFDRLEAYIYEMHDRMMICHGDLEPRNIMIDLPAFRE
jgi:thiamine kinase-like enzyme